jgi:crossover junction endodeoxyribonuclease RusA
MTVAAVIQLAILRDTLLTSNMRLHWRPKAERTRAIREMALVWCRHTRPAKMQSATCDVEIKWGDRRQRDSHNAQPSIKAAIDGIVGDYGLLPGDDDRYLKSLTITASDEVHTTPGIACYLTLRFTEVPHD